MISLLTLLDDIAAALDDVAVMTKIAVQKTSVLMSDDLAVNAGVIQGVGADREIPMVKSIFLGSLLNKVYCISGVLILMATYPPAIKWIMFIGGLYLCYEGAHKVMEKLFHKNKSKTDRQSVSEDDKVKGAIRTDLILSIEIIVIAKSTLSGSFLTQVLSLIAVGLIASILIYGLVAIIIKIDDFGLYLFKKDYKKLGMSFIKSMPYCMRGLGIIGTVAMFLVGGGIVVHTFHFPYLLNEHIQNLIVGSTLGMLCVGLLKSKDLLLTNKK